MLELKKYQEEVMNDLIKYLDSIIEQKKQEDEYNEYLKSKGKDSQHKDIFKEAWSKVSEEEYIQRVNGLKESIPHVCLKVPTGGGKTLLATHAVKLINQHYLRRNTGLVLWVVPSQAIYSQTLKAFKNLDHPYRAVLDRAAPYRRANIVERQSVLNPSNVLDDLSVMILMIQAAGRESKDTLRMFRDNGNFMGFFPDSNNHQKHSELLEEYTNLDYHQGVGQTRVVKYSLANVLKILRPIIVLDEGHTATSPIRKETFNQFNPRFILELSATPPAESNVLVNVPGRVLKEEEMIKLPIQLKNCSGGDWKITLSDACERLHELTKQAETHRNNVGKYIRPILLVRVEATGKNQREKGKIHAEDAREYLTTQLGFKEDEVKLKTSEVDEITNEDLLSPYSPVKAIITKDALKEGWDCPFAYVLALLDKTSDQTNLTQMIGRVLRQPYTELTGIDDLDTAHVFCSNQNVGKIVSQIQKSLNDHGLGDTGKGVILREEEKTTELVGRRKEFSGEDIFMPKVLYKDGGDERPLEYERDILANIKWEELKNTEQGLLLENEQQITEGWINVSDKELSQRREALEGEVDEVFFAENLSDIIPNPWQAMRIAKDAFPFISKGGSKKDIYNDRMNIVRKMRADIENQKESKSQSLFCNMIAKKNVMFTIDATKSNWKIPNNIMIKHLGPPKYLTKPSGEQLALSIFEKYEERSFNEFEKSVAHYIDEGKAIKWWHRVVARQEYGLQGWRKHLVYPDFVALISKEKDQSIILETKGNHLAGNDDTNYKKQLFDILEKNYLEVGNIEMDSKEGSLLLRIIFEGTAISWKDELAEIGIN